MKKIVIFVHGEIFQTFAERGNLHKQLEKKSGQKLFWQLIPGYLSSQSDNFPFVLEKLKEADIFICDSDNSNLKGKMEELNFEAICFNDLIEALKKIREKNPRLKIFIKNFPYTLKKETERLSFYGEIVNDWLDEKIITDLK